MAPCIVDSALDLDQSLWYTNATISATLFIAWDLLREIFVILTSRAGVNWRLLEETPNYVLMLLRTIIWPSTPLAILIFVVGIVCIVALSIRRHSSKALRLHTQGR